MAENDENLGSRSENSKRIKELERAVKAILEAFKNVEKETGEVYVPEGTYYGVSFED